MNVTQFFSKRYGFMMKYDGFFVPPEIPCYQGETIQLCFFGVLVTGSSSQMEGSSMRLSGPSLLTFQREDAPEISKCLRFTRNIADFPKIAYRILKTANCFGITFGPVISNAKMIKNVASLVSISFVCQRRCFRKNNHCIGRALS